MPVEVHPGGRVEPDPHRFATVEFDTGARPATSDVGAEALEVEPDFRGGPQQHRIVQARVVVEERVRELPVPPLRPRRLDRERGLERHRVTIEGEVSEHDPQPVPVLVPQLSEVFVQPGARTALVVDERVHDDGGVGRTGRGLVPVVEGEQLVGLVTLTNVLAATDSFLRDDQSRIHANEIGVKDTMVTDVATVDINASLRHAALFLEKHKIGCLPVLDDGKLVGIITDTDFVAVAINLLEQLEETEPFDDDYEDVFVA